MAMAVARQIPEKRALDMGPPGKLGLDGFNIGNLVRSASAVMNLPLKCALTIRPIQLIIGSFLALDC
jgi:hypothetical protein